MDDLVQLDQYMSMVFDEAENEKNKKIAKLKEDKNFDDDGNDWWLEERAFETDVNGKKNPFGVKK